MIQRILFVGKQAAFWLLLGTGSLFLHIGLRKLARRLYVIGLSGWPENRGDALAALGLYCGESGEPDQGIAYLKEALTLTPNDPRKWVYLGWICEDHARLAEAIDSYKRALTFGAALSETERHELQEKIDRLNEML